MNTSKINTKLKFCFGKNYIRLFVWMFIFSSIYISLIYNLFILNNIVNWLIYVMLAFITGMFLYIDMHKLAKKVQLVLFSILFAVWLVIFLFWNFSISNMLTFIILNVTIFLLYISLKYVNFAPWKYFFSSGYLFSLLCAIWMSVFLIWQYNWLNLQCEDINQYTDKFMEIVKDPFTKLGAHGSANTQKPIAINIQDIENSIQDFKKATQEIIQTSSDKIDQTTQQINTTITNTQDKVSDLSSWFSDISNSVKETSMLDSLNSQIDNIKEQWVAIMGTIDENKSFLSVFYCQKILDSLNWVSNGIWIAAVIIFTLVFWWVIRLIVSFFSVLGYLVFKLLQVLWFYKSIKLKKEVNDII